MCPSCVCVCVLTNLWQVCRRRLAFSALQSIFNPVAPLPDGPAIYGNDWVHMGRGGCGGERRMDQCRGEAEGKESERESERETWTS